MTTFLLVGHGGFYNRGCEAIVRTTVTLLRERFDDPRIILASMSYEEDRVHEAARGIDVIPDHPRMRRGSLSWTMKQLGKVTRHHWRWSADYYTLWRPLAECTAVLSIGGDNYTVDYGYPSDFLALNELAHRAHKPMIIWGASIGPLPRSPEEDEVLGSLRRVALITARESTTVAYLAEAGLRDNVHAVADPAFLLPTEATDTSGYWPEGDAVLGLNISPLLQRYRKDSADDPFPSLAKRFIEDALDRLGLGVLLIPHVTREGNNDWEYLNRIRSQVDRPQRVTLAPPSLTAPQTKSVISQCRYLVAARTHATIAGFSTGTPTISLAYSQKALGINQDIFGHQRWVVDTHRLARSGDLTDALEALMDEEASVRQHLATKQPWLREQARHAVDLLATVVESEVAHGEA